MILKREENENDAWELRWVFKALMLKGKYVISVYLRCMKGKSPSGKCPECKQIRGLSFCLSIFLDFFICLLEFVNGYVMNPVEDKLFL